MKLSQLLTPWVHYELPDHDILGIHNDSRQIASGFLFIAYPGTVTDGRLFIPQAITAGAVATLYEPENWPDHCQLPDEHICIAIPGLATKIAQIASRFYHEPTKKLAVVGVTGTNGKTTIAYQLAQAHSLLGKRAAYVGTLGQGSPASLQPLMNTTPDALCLQGLLHTYQQQQIEEVCMEVSSHALHQKRVAEIDFKQAIFTNLSHEHLDYHHTMEAYAAAKSLLFAVPTLKWAIVNRDDEYHQLMSDAVNASCQTLSYGIEKKAHVRALHWDITMTGTKVDISSPWGQQQLSLNSLGFFNIYNALAIFSALASQGYALDKIVAAMAELQAAPGRMEIVTAEPCVIVDYAHTPAALENALSTLKKISTGRILAVFGCGGDRDTTKRPLMGKIASQYADVIILTNDNPRNENPLEIINAIEKGISPLPAYKIPDREQAIAKALSLANKNDIILIAGKGHESYQQIGNTHYPFSDQDTIRRLLFVTS